MVAWLVFGVALPLLAIVLTGRVFDASSPATSDVFLTMLFIAWSAFLFHGVVHPLRRAVVIAIGAALILYSCSIGIARAVEPAAVVVVQSQPKPNLGSCQWIDAIPACPGLSNYIAVGPDSFATCADGPTPQTAALTGLDADTLGTVVESVVGILQTLGAENTNWPVDERPARTQLCIAEIRRASCSLFFPPCTAQCEPASTCWSVCPRLNEACDIDPLWIKYILPGGAKGLYCSLLT